MKEKILVTGHASGIGNHIAKRFHESGYSVIGLDLNLATDLPADVVQVQCDLSDEESVTNVFNQLDTFSIAVNCAGISGVRKEICKLKTKDIMDSWKGIFLPTFLSLREEVLIMRKCPAETKGRIVNISSFTALYGGKNMLAYSSSKAAIVNLTKVAAAENSPNIFVNSVSPATIDTPMIRKKYNGGLPNYENSYLTGNCGSPEDVFIAVNMLINNNFMTGYDLVIDGGFSSNFELKL